MVCILCNVVIWLQMQHNFPHNINYKSCYINLNKITWKATKLSSTIPPIQMLSTCENGTRCLNSEKGFPLVIIYKKPKTMIGRSYRNSIQKRSWITYVTLFPEKGNKIPHYGVDPMEMPSAWPVSSRAPVSIKGHLQNAEGMPASLSWEYVQT